MENKLYVDKNILFLFPDSSNQYRNYHYNYLKDKARELILIDFHEYCNRHGIRNTKKHIKETIKNNNIELLVVFPFSSEYQLSVEFFRQLRSMTKVVMWTWDCEMYFNSYDKYYAQAADAVVVNDIFTFDSYKQLNIEPVLYFSSYSKEDYKPYAVKKDIDVSFVGDCTKADRKEYISYLKQNNINIVTYGKGSENGLLKFEDFSKVFSRSKINLNFTKHNGLGWVNKHDPLVMRTRQSKGRPIEIAMTKSFCLSEDSKSLEAVFSIGKEIDVFVDKETLLKKVSHYLSHEGEREAIALKAYERALNNYESGIYLKNLFEQIEKACKVAKKLDDKIYLSDNFKVNTINCLTFTMFVMLSKGSIIHIPEIFLNLFKYGPFCFIKGFYGGLIRVLKNRLAHIISD